MPEVHDPTNQFEVHDPDILAQAKAILDACSSPQEMQEAVLAAVARNEEWRGKRCLNLLAPEAPTSPTVRALLSAEVGTRAAEGHIGPVNRWFAGTRYIDEIEALCVELLKKAFRARNRPWVGQCFAGNRSIARSGDRYDRGNRQTLPAAAAPASSDCRSATPRVRHRGCGALVRCPAE